jgi:hypothetical protein
LERFVGFGAGFVDEVFALFIGHRKNSCSGILRSFAAAVAAVLAAVAARAVDIRRSARRAAKNYQARSADHISAPADRA